MQEYGGYLPIELKSGKEYYGGENVVSLNCARNGIAYSAIVGAFKKVYVPFYICNTVIDALIKHNVEYELYHMDEEFRPLQVYVKKQECILYPNYYGLFSEKRINSIVKQYGNVILDNTQAFFATPNVEAFNVYSCRKFIGVSDGAYVIKEGIRHMPLDADRSYSRAVYLMKSIEEGTNAAYTESLRAEENLCDSPILAMSALTHRILQSADYEYIKKRRIHNFDFMNKSFINMGMKPVCRSEECVPMVYPFWSEDADIRKKMIERHIYVPQWWRNLLDRDEITSFERKLINSLLPLPVDQRYQEDDIKGLVDIIADIL